MSGKMSQNDENTGEKGENHVGDAEERENPVENVKKTRKRVKKPENPLKKQMEAENGAAVDEILRFFDKFPDFVHSQDFFSAWAAVSLIMARLRAGMTQQELSRRSGVRQQAISAYEDERQVPTVGRWLALMKACHDVQRLTSDPAGGGYNEEGAESANGEEED